MRVIIKRVDEKTTQQIILNVAKSMVVKELQNEIKKTWDIEPECQRLLYGGKILQGKNTLMDYGLDNDRVIQLAVRYEKSSEIIKPASKFTKDIKTIPIAKKTLPQKHEDVNNEIDEQEEEIDSLFYKENDLIDCKHTETGAWFEAFFIKAVKKSGSILCRVKFYRDDTFYETTEDNIRPRARHILDPQDLEPGKIVMLNYNFDEPSKVGFWYDFEISEVTKNRKSYFIKGHIDLGGENKTYYEIRNKCEIYVIEVPKKIQERDDELYKDDGKRRQMAPFCDECGDDVSQMCYECGCRVCAKKEDDNKLLVCDECEDYFHLWCLSPPLKDIPGGDWYCSKCEINKNEIVHEGDDLKKSKKQRASDKAKRQKKNWGGGYACVGLRERSDLPHNHRGPVPGVEVGNSWLYRFQVSEVGVHRPPVQGIHGRENDCAYSLVLSGGYEDDVDNGDSFDYTGSGGRDLSGNKRTAKQSFDQKLIRDNKALALNCDAKLNAETGATAKNWKNGIPVRVIRSYKMHKSKKHSENPYAPKMGYRYDGIYKVVSYRPVKGKSGFIVWRYKLRRDDPDPAPWTTEGQKRMKELGLTMQYPSEDYLNKRKSSDSAEDEPQPKKKKIKTYELDTEVIKLMQKDKLNEKKWTDLNSHLFEGRIAYDKCVKDAFICPCCQNVIFKPVTTPCQHNMCSGCLKGAWNSGYNACPVCRSNLPKDFNISQVNETLHEILLKLNIVHEVRPKQIKRRQ